MIGVPSPATMIPTPGTASWCSTPASSVIGVPAGKNPTHPICVQDGCPSAGWTRPKLTKDTFNALPCVYRVEWPNEPDDDGKWKPKKLRSGPLCDRAACSLSLDGYKRMRVMRGIALVDDPTFITHVLPPADGRPVRLLPTSELMVEDEAWESLERAFPGLDRALLQVCLAARVCAEHGSRPPILVVVGPTGSGKGEIVRLAASFFGDDRHTLTVQEEEKMRRELGSALEEGHRFFAFDEVARRPAGILPFILQLSSRLDWRALYESANVSSNNRGVYFLTGVTLPDLFKKSPEFRRRAKLVRLLRKVPVDWITTVGETVSWRGQSDEHARSANSLLTHVHALCAEHGFRFEPVAEALGVEKMGEEDAENDARHLVALYRHCRGEDGARKLDTSNRYKAGRWVSALSEGCRELLEHLLPDSDTATGNPAEALFQVRQNLAAVAWNQILRIDEPPILCEMRRHRGKVVIRFRDASRNQKGDPAVGPDHAPGFQPAGDGTVGPASHVAVVHRAWLPGRCGCR